MVSLTFAYITDNTEYIYFLVYSIFTWFCLFGLGEQKSQDRSIDFWDVETFFSADVWISLSSSF